MFFCCLITLCMASCKSAKESVSLTGVKWVAESLNGKEIKFKESESGVFVTFEANEKKVFGRAGCNRFFGAYEQDETQLTFSGMGATKMACPDMDIETTFFKVLEDTKSFVIKNNKLTLKDDNNVIAVFKAEKEKSKKE
ncbi:META domain-containing protein [Odoribacter sp. AF15-53]|nr:META domain-containing protein [Odoribacter sp. AF15-53]